jgi:hypothetical protein
MPDLLMEMLGDHRLPAAFLVAAGVQQIQEWQSKARRGAMGVIDLERGMRG